MQVNSSLKNRILVRRFKKNPLVRPDSETSWMNVAVLNCGVVKKNGKYKMIFRAVNRKDHLGSSLGLAESKDGQRWILRAKPVLKTGFNKHCQWGIEDPRIVKWIDGRYYLFTTVLDRYGDNSLKIRIGIWRTEDFLNYEWIGIPFDWEDKDAAIFPETIDGWVYLLHRKKIHIWISRTKDLTLRGGWQDSRILARTDEFYPSPNTGSLPKNIGIAGPPIKTKKGWLVITHSNYKGENKAPKLDRLYTLGFMVLDLKDPAKVNYVHPEPILLPAETYEKDGCVPNVVYSCATVDAKKDAVYIYWGGADTVICGGKLLKKDLPMCY